MRYFLDRSLGSRILPTLLREHGWVVETMDERYGAERSQRVKDVTWIEDLGEGEIALTSDGQIGKVAIQAEAIRRRLARILVIDANLTAREQAARLLDSQMRIERVAIARSGPWILSAGADGLRDLRMKER